MADDVVASMKIARLVRRLVRDRRTNPAAPRSTVREQPVIPQPGPVEG
ncbi:MAG: hypothetical protein ACRDRX_00175 [Pseudonocardiaceae bacterium]